MYHLLERRRVKEFSFGYTVRDAETAKDGAYNLLDIDLFELGPTLKGMNPETELLAVKALADATDPPAGRVRGCLKAGARHSKETVAALSRIRAEVDALLGTGESADDETPKSVEAEAVTGKASDPDEDINTQIQLLKGTTRMTQSVKDYFKAEAEAQARARRRHLRRGEHRRARHDRGRADQGVDPDRRGAGAPEACRRPRSQRQVHRDHRRDERQDDRTRRAGAGRCPFDR